MRAIFRRIYFALQGAFARTCLSHSQLCDRDLEWTDDILGENSSLKVGCLNPFALESMCSATKPGSVEGDHSNSSEYEELARNTGGLAGPSDQPARSTAKFAMLSLREEGVGVAHRASSETSEGSETEAMRLWKSRQKKLDRGNDNSSSSRCRRPHPGRSGGSGEDSGEDSGQSSGQSGGEGSGTMKNAQRRHS